MRTLATLFSFCRIMLAVSGLALALRAPAQTPAPAVRLGEIRVHCVPLAGRVTIPGLTGVESVGGGLWVFADLPPGNYEATITALSKRVVLPLTVADGSLTEVTVNLFKGTSHAGPPDPAGQAPAPPLVPPSAPPTGAALAAKAAAALRAASRFTIPDLGITMIAVAPGSFTYGSDTGGHDERPAVPGTITRRFWLGRTEVSQGQWSRLMEHNNSAVQGAELPVECVSWIEAMEFCRKLTAREQAAGRLPADFHYTLPLEIQWEYACRAGGVEGTARAVGLSDWFAGNSGDMTHPVGRMEPNAWGFCDMRGNVAEWCLDWFGPHPTGAVNDLGGVATGEKRALRGGTFRFPAAACRATLRNAEVPDHSHANVGFRVVLVETPAKR